VDRSVPVTPVSVRSHGQSRALGLAIAEMSQGQADVARALSTPTGQKLKATMLAYVCENLKTGPPANSVVGEMGIDGQAEPRTEKNENALKVKRPMKVSDDDWYWWREFQKAGVLVNNKLSVAGANKDKLKKYLKVKPLPQNQDWEKSRKADGPR